METMFNNGMCRCCASEGTFKDLATKYRWMGVDEVYADMLRECFDVTLSSPDDSLEGGICEVCITQLRNAANFKKQVLNTEEQFKRVLQNRPFKSNIVKVEVSAPDDELRLTDEDNNMSNDDFSGPEYEIPIKTESSEEGKSSRKRSKAGPSRKKMDGETSSKRDANSEIEPYVKVETPQLLQIEQDIQKSIRLKYVFDIFKYTMVVPFKISPGFRCFYCNETGFKNMDELHIHTLANHATPTMADIENALGKTTKPVFIPVNVLNLGCRLCQDDIIDFRDLEKHLAVKHGVEQPDNRDPVMIPFKIGGGKTECALCWKQFGSFKSLSNHMNEHYPNYKCETCNAVFLSAERLKNHRLGHAFSNSFHLKRTEHVAPNAAMQKTTIVTKPTLVKQTATKMVKPVQSTTVKAKKVAKQGISPTMRNKLDRRHRLNEAITMIKYSTLLPFKCQSGFKCYFCESCFGEMEQLQQHNDVDHPNPDDETFRRALISIKIDQVAKVNTVNLKCKLCDDALTSLEHLKEHLSTKHGKTFIADNDFFMPFKIWNGICECLVCGETQPGYKTLSQHMNVHYRNYICELCGAGFLTTTRLRAHSKTHLSHVHPCGVCGKQFKTKDAMIRHKSYVHDRQCSSKCPHCQEMFIDYFSRQRHISKVHNVELKRHKCYLCDSSFLVMGQLLKHIKISHQKERAHECVECHKKFFYKIRLEEHVRSAHRGISIACDWCSRSYSSKKSLYQHAKKAHPERQFNCEYCNMSFAKKKTLATHIKNNHVSGIEGSPKPCVGLFN